MSGEDNKRTKEEQLKILEGQVAVAQEMLEQAQKDLADGKITDETFQSRKRICDKVVEDAALERTRIEES